MSSPMELFMLSFLATAKEIGQEKNINLKEFEEDDDYQQQKEERHRAEKKNDDDRVMIVVDNARCQGRINKDRRSVQRTISSPIKPLHQDRRWNNGSSNLLLRNRTLAPYRRNSFRL